jgi:hypothetical protein
VDEALIRSLMAPGPKKSKAPQEGQERAIMSDGAVLPLKQVITQVGGFEGNAGTLARSRKGRVYRKPNGRRFYCSSYETPEVLAYLARGSK